MGVIEIPETDLRGRIDKEQPDGKLPAALAHSIGRSDLARPEKKKRRTIYEQAGSGDLVVAFLGVKSGTAKLVAIERVTLEQSGSAIYERWLDQGVIASGQIQIEVWEERGGHYRKRKAGR